MYPKFSVQGALMSGRVSVCVQQSHNMHIVRTQVPAKCCELVFVHALSCCFPSAMSSWLFLTVVCFELALNYFKRLRAMLAAEDS